MKLKTLFLAVLTLFALGFLLPVVSTSFAQLPEQEAGREVLAKPVTPPPEVRDVYYFRSKTGKALELATAAESLFGRSFSSPSWESTMGNMPGGRLTRNIVVIDRTTIVVFETAERAKQILELFENLDKDTQPKVAGSEVVAVEYAPRYLDVNDLMSALGPYRRQDTNGFNIAALNETGKLILRDEQRLVDEMTTLLASLDVPSPQIEISCYVLSGSSSPDTTGMVPKELSDNLSRLVPFVGFQLESYGILRTTTLGSRKGVAIEMPGGLSHLDDYRMALRVAAFDAKTKVISLSECSVSASPKDGRRGSTMLFSTSTSIQAGEYAVIGATGATPTFVVLRFQQVGG